MPEQTPKIEDKTINRTAQVDSCYKYLYSTISNISNDILRDSAKEILVNFRRFETPASHKYHQSYTGGLMVHVAEVMEIALNIAKSQCLDVNFDVLISGITWHDYGKLFDYQQNEDGTYSYTKHANLIKHLSASYALFSEKIKAPSVPVDIIHQIGHIILSHHGRREFGSPIEPKTTEAFMEI